MPTPDQHDLKAMANAVRALAMDAVEQAKSGHPGMPLGMADAATVLFAHHLKFDPAAADWADRDRFVLSAGHGSMLLYALLHLTGYADMTIEEIKRFRQLGSKTAGHPEYGHAAGIETTTGPLGQGLANAVGMALAEAHLAARFGSDLVDHHTWVVAGDGCLMEGISQEAIALAGQLRLNKLIVIWDDNAISIDGPVSLSDRTDQRARFEASGWRTMAVDGHDIDALDAAFAEAKVSDRPVLIACKTTIGFGAPTRAGTSKAHGEPLGPDEIAGARAALGWPHAPFEVPEPILAHWRGLAQRGQAVHAAWKQRLASSPNASALTTALATDPRPAIAALGEHAVRMAAEAPTLATRAASGKALEVAVPAFSELLGGSADLTPSNNTLVKGMTDLSAKDYGGRYVRYGVREHGMAAVMNGLALHGGVVPYGGTFLAFADYSRPAIRLAALMGIRVIHVMTHDSIGLGEDGPTHQPVEQLASLRAIPNLLVFRPADAVETAECWSLALSRTDQPSILALSRQATAPVRTDGSENKSARGAYELVGADGGDAQVSLFATGTEVPLALEARGLLQGAGIPTRVVSCPCFELFEEQSFNVQAEVLGPPDAIRLGIEAGVGNGWFETFELDGFVGMAGFGASAPAKDLFRHFGLTAENIAAIVHEMQDERG